jgi:hypothetical protein
MSLESTRKNNKVEESNQKRKMRLKERRHEVGKNI